MELWLEPMTANVAAVLLAGLATLFVLIGLEIRSHRAEANGPAQPQSATEGALVRTGILLGLTLAPFAVIGFLLGAWVAAAALALAVGTVLWSFRHTGPAILARCGAREVRDRNLVEAVEELAAKAGIPPPRLLEIQETHPNAFALGSEPAHAAIVVTLGLRNRLNSDELRAVIGHEISHIARRDTLKATIGVMLMSAIAALALRLGLIGLSARRQGLGALLFLVIFAPVSALVLRLGGSRARVYQADRDGALMCGNPADLIRALSRLEVSARRIASITANDQPALAALFIVNPLPNSWVGGLFAGHPPLARRIARLTACSEASPVALPGAEAAEANSVLPQSGP
jgi:heat shock protein HtpX